MAATAAGRRGTGQSRKIRGSSTAIDLDAMVADRTLEPVPIRLFGEEWKLRRDLTPNEAADWLNKLNADTVTVERVFDGETVEVEVDGEAAAWGILLGDLDLGIRLNDILLDKPREHVRIIGQECIRRAGLGDLVGLGRGEDSSSGEA